MTNRLRTLLALIIGSTVLVSAGRFTVPGHDLSWQGTYEAVVHIWVGVMLALCLAPLLIPSLRSWDSWDTAVRTAWLCFWCLLAATVVEIIMFLAR